MPRYDDFDPTIVTPKAAGGSQPASGPSPAAGVSPALIAALRRNLLVVRTLCIVLIALSILLSALVYRLSGRVEAAERAANAVPAAIGQAADQKLAELAPQLEQRLARFEQMSNRIEKNIVAAENGMLERVRTEAPKILDTYVQKKIVEIQREAEKAQAQAQAQYQALPKKK